MVEQKPKGIDITLYTIVEASEVIGCSVKSIRNYIASGKLKAHKVGGKWKMYQEDIEAFMRGQ